MSALHAYPRLSLTRLRKPAPAPPPAVALAALSLLAAVAFFSVSSLPYALQLPLLPDPLHHTRQTSRRRPRPPAPPPAFSPPHLASLSPLQHSVRNATRVLYRSYLSQCSGYDELVPSTGACSDWFGIGLTLLDSLDTLVLMRLTEEYAASRAWVERHLSFSKPLSVSTFEVTIRALGGLNSAYELTGDTLWLDKAVELADGLLHAFLLTPSRCPTKAVQLGGGANEQDRVWSNPAEAGTLQLEFRTLSRLTGDQRYAVAVDRCMESLLHAASHDPLVTDSFSLRDGMFEGRRISFGAMVDSFYEMMAKTWVAFGKQDSALRVAFERAVEAAYDQLVHRKHGYDFVGEFEKGQPDSFRNSMEHLTCFLPGTLAYAALHGLGGGLNGTHHDSYLARARSLTRSCHAMSTALPHGLASEVTDFSGAYPRPRHGLDFNLLRPEIVEALYYMDQVDPQASSTYKRWGTTMWDSLRRFAQVPGKEPGMLSSTYNLGGVAGLPGLVHTGKLHSFALAETFKYFFLLFDDRPTGTAIFPLDQWVYNTEAHPVRIVPR